MDNQNQTINTTEITSPILKTGIVGSNTDDVSGTLNNQLLAEPATTTSTDMLFNLLEVGGPVVWILCAFSIFALTLILLKFWQLSIAGAGGKRKTNRAIALWNQGKQTEAINQLSQSQQVLPRLIGTAMIGVQQQGDTPQLREELSRLASVEMENLRSYLRPLEVIANLSPLLGLLGTVLGMIVAFQQMELAGNQVDPSVLSGGIWQALLTTAAGLIVAIPVFLAHSTLERKTERIAHDMEVLVTSVFTRNCLVAIPVVKTQSKAETQDSTWENTQGATNAA